MIKIKQPAIKPLKCPIKLIPGEKEKIKPMKHIIFKILKISLFFLKLILEFKK